MKRMIQLSILSALVILGAANIVFYDQCELQEGVTLTGYFTPVETEYSDDEHTRVKTDAGYRSYRKGFWKDVLIEWVGISEHDGVVGIWEMIDGKPDAHIDQGTPLDAEGGDLRPYSTGLLFTPGTAASNNLPPGTVLRIVTSDSLPLWMQPLYRVTDTIGGPHDEIHVDLYMGEGLAAKAKTEEVTMLDGTGRICVYQ